MYKKTRLFKKYDYPSWSLAPRVGDNGQIIIHKDNQVTNGKKYIDACKKCSLEGTGYTLNLYKKHKGIKGVKINKPLKPIRKQVDVVKDFRAGFIQYGLNNNYIK